MSETLYQMGSSHHTASSPGQGDLWASLLGSVAASTNKILPTRSLIVLGASSGIVEQFVRNLQRALPERKIKQKRELQVPFAPSAVAGYTYLDFADPENEGRLIVYTVTDMHSSAMILLQDFLKDQGLSDCSVCMVLDWKAPWTWLHELRHWVISLKDILATLQEDSEAVKNCLQQQIKLWEVKMKSTNDKLNPSTAFSKSMELGLTLPSERGNYDDALGLSLYCVAQNSLAMQDLEREHAFREEHFDYIQQVLRTILLKYGGTLIYTKDHAPASLGLPLRTILQQQMPTIYQDMQLQSTPDLPNTMERESAFVPAGWDSWGKIVALREGFNAEEIADGWAQDTNLHKVSEANSAVSTVNVFEKVIKPSDRSRVVNYVSTEDFVEPIDQTQLLERIEQRQSSISGPSRSHSASPEIERDDTSTRDRPTLRSLNDQEVDVDEMDAKLRDLRDRADRSSSRALTTDTSVNISSVNKDEYVQAFFQNLLSRNNSERA